MSATEAIEPGRVIDLSREVIGVGHADGRARIIEQQPGRAPQRIDGVSIGAPMLTGDAPHDGEVHPDGDEILFLASGAVTVELEFPEGDRTIDLGAGDAVVVPQGVWHRVKVREHGVLVHITPGPGGDHRPLGERR